MYVIEVHICICNWEGKILMLWKKIAGIITDLGTGRFTIVIKQRKANSRLLINIFIKHKYAHSATLNYHYKNNYLSVYISYYTV